MLSVANSPNRVHTRNYSASGSWQSYNPITRQDKRLDLVLQLAIMATIRLLNDVTKSNINRNLLTCTCTCMHVYMYMYIMCAVWIRNVCDHYFCMNTQEAALDMTIESHKTTHDMVSIGSSKNTCKLERQAHLLTTAIIAMIWKLWSTILKASNWLVHTRYQREVIK